MGNEDKKHSKDNKEGIERVKKLVSGNRAAALGFAVCFALSVTTVGCHRNVQDDEDDDWAYVNSGYHGGGYYFSGGSTYRTGSWSKASSKITGSGSTKGYSGSSSSKSYAAARGGSIGG